MIKVFLILFLFIKQYFTQISQWPMTISFDASILSQLLQNALQPLVRPDYLIQQYNSSKYRIFDWKLQANDIQVHNLTMNYHLNNFTFNEFNQSGKFDVSQLSTRASIKFKFQSYIMEAQGIANLFINNSISSCFTLETQNNLPYWNFYYLNLDFHNFEVSIDGINSGGILMHYLVTLLNEQLKGVIQSQMKVNFNRVTNHFLQSIPKSMKVYEFLQINTTIPEPSQIINGKCIMKMNMSVENFNHSNTFPSKNYNNIQFQHNHHQLKQDYDGILQLKQNQFNQDYILQQYRQLNELHQIKETCLTKDFNQSYQQYEIVFNSTLINQNQSNNSSLIIQISQDIINQMVLSYLQKQNFHEIHIDDDILIPVFPQIIIHYGLNKQTKVNLTILDQPIIKISQQNISINITLRSEIFVEIQNKSFEKAIVFDQYISFDALPFIVHDNIALKIQKAHIYYTQLIYSTVGNIDLNIFKNALQIIIDAIQLILDQILDKFGLKMNQIGCFIINNKSILLNDQSIQISAKMDCSHLQLKQL